MSMLRANSLVPLYEQLYLRLRTAIEEGDLSVGGPVPSERQLAADYGISRVTTRKALDRLRQEGFVRAYQGRGSFVAPGAPGGAERTRTAERMTFQGFSAAMLDHGLVPSSKLISRGIVSATGAIAHYLGIGENERVIRIRRLRLANDTPMALHTSYLLYPLCCSILEIDLEKQSLYRILQESLSIRLAHVDREARAISGSDQDLAFLDLRPPALLMQVMRRTFDEDGRVVEYLQAVQREDAAVLAPHVRKL